MFHPQSLKRILNHLVLIHILWLRLLSSQKDCRQDKDGNLFPTREGRWPNQHRLRQYPRRVYVGDPIKKSQRNSPGSSQSASRTLTETTRDNQRALWQVDNFMAQVQSVQPDLPATFLNPLATVYVPSPVRSAPSVKHLECFFWRRGSCKFTAQECLYAHEPTGQMAEGPRAVELGSQ